MAASPAAACHSCCLVFRVKEVQHWCGQQALRPGTKPGRLFKPAIGKFRSVEDEDTGSHVSLHDAVGEVCLTASGYSWRCPECDNVNYSPEITFQEVHCILCRSRFEVSEARHRTSFGDLGIGVHPGAVWLTKQLASGQDEDESDQAAGPQQARGALPGSPPGPPRAPDIGAHSSFVTPSDMCFSGHARRNRPG